MFRYVIFVRLQLVHSTSYLDHMQIFVIGKTDWKSKIENLQSFWRHHGNNAR